MSKYEPDFVAAFGKIVSDYDYTDSLTDTDWAWEFLRRNPEYQRDYYECRTRASREFTHPSGIRIYRERACNCKPQNWKLSTFSNPRFGTLESDIFWSQDALTHSIKASAYREFPENDMSDLDLFRDQNCCAILCGSERQKIIIRSKNTAVDMKLIGISVLFQPVQLQFHLSGFSTISPDTKSLKWSHNALKSLRSGDKKPLTKATKSYRKKCLIALDCNQKSASLRDTAYVFKAMKLTRLTWSTSGNEALKKQVWRCRNTGLKLMQGAYRKFL